MQPGAAVSTTASSTGAQYVQSGGSATDTLLSGGAESVASGGVTISAIILSNGTEYLSSGCAVGEYLTVSGGGLLSGPGELIGANSAAGTVNGVMVGDLPPCGFARTAFGRRG